MLQEGQHPLTGQHTANFRRDLGATYLLPLTCYKAKRVKTFLEAVRQFEPRFQGEGVVPRDIFWFLEN